MLGWERVASKKHLWLIAVVLLVGWLYVNWLRMQETSQFEDGYRAVLQSQIEVFEACQSDAGLVPEWLGNSRGGDDLAKEIGELMRVVEKEEVATSSLYVDMALVCHVMHSARPGKGWDVAAQRYYRAVIDPDQSGYYPQFDALIRGDHLAESEVDNLKYMLEGWPDDWWIVTLGESFGIDVGDGRAVLRQRGKTATWKGFLAAVLDWSLVVVAIVSVPLVWRRARQVVPAPLYGERMLKLVPVPVMVISFSLVMWLTYIAVVVLITAFSFMTAFALDLTEFDWYWWAWWVFTFVAIVSEPWLMRLFAGLTRGSTTQLLGWKWRELAMPKNILFAFGCACITLSVMWLLVESMYMLGFDSGVPDGLRFVDTHLTLPAQIALMLYGGVLAPIIEEMVFRGLLFRNMRKAWGALAGALVSSVIFAAIHAYGPVGTMGTFVYGLVFCWIYHRTGSLAVSALTHSWINFTIGLSSWLYGW